MSEQDKKKALLEELKDSKAFKKFLSESKGSKTRNQSGDVIPTPFLAFTFFYSVSIYLMLLAFFIWLKKQND